MRTKGVHPKDFVVRLLKRSNCRVQVAACLSDTTGIYAWGINHAGPDGFGECAEQHCLKKANYKRIPKSTMWIAGRRKKSKNTVLARPCAACFPLVRSCRYIIFQKKDRTWETIDTSLIV